MLLVLPALFLPPSTAVAAETRTIRLLETSDLHGNVEGWNYFTDRASSSGGMARIVTYLNSVRAANPNTLIVDDGDTIQGTPLTYLYNILTPSVPNPMAVGMNFMGYAAMTIGNHEFNFGQAVLNKIRGEMTFPMLAANCRLISDNSLVFDPYIIKDIGGVQVGILGLTNTSIPYWEKPENIAGLKFTNPVTEANFFVPLMKAAGADVIVIAAHSGMDETYGYGHEENFIKDLADFVPGVDVILAGHAHAEVNTVRNGVLITEPTNAGAQVADITITVSGEGSTWAVTTKTATIARMAGRVEDPAFLALMKPYHDATRVYINTPIGLTTGAFPGGSIALYKDGPTADLINLVQTEAAAAAGFPVDASCAALFNDQAALPAGVVKLKDAYALYIYDNTLYVLRCTGQTVKEVLEWTVGYFATYSFNPAGPSATPNFPSYNYDMWTGIDYQVDLTKPIGSRIINLTLNGAPITPTQILNVAANNYRATGMFMNPAKVTIPATALYASATEVRELVTDYIQTHSPLDPNVIYVHNWDLLPNPDLWINPNATTSKTDYLNLVNFAFGDPTSSAFFVGDRQKRTGLIFDPVEKDFVFLTKDKSFGERLVPNAVISGNLIKFTYMGADLQVRADINLAGASVIMVDDWAGGKSYILQSSENGNVFNTERALAYLVNEAMSGLVSPVADWTKLQTYSDWKLVSPWAGSAYTFMTGSLTFSTLAPLSPVTNFNALKWMQETRFPLVSFISTSDFHGSLDPVTVTNTKMGGAAFDATYIKNYKALNPLGTFLVDSGDIMQGTLISNYFKGASTIDVFNQIGYQVSTIGNHEFDWGQVVLQQRITQAQFPWLNCNVFLKGTNVQPSWLKPYVILEAKGLKVGFIGMIGTDAPTKIMPGNVDNLDFKDPAPIINQIAASLRAQGVNMIVVLAHMGGQQDASGVITGQIADLANALVGINYIAAGDMHNKLNSSVNGIPITEPYSTGSALGLAKIRVDRLTGTTFGYTLEVNNTTNLGVTPDSTIATVVAAYNAEIATIKNQWVGTITGPINRDTPDRYTQESAVGNLIADSMAWKAGVAIAFMNPGGIRANIVSSSGVYPYNVIWNDLYTVQPFDNLLTSMDLTGAQIKALLEQCYGPANPSKKMLQVSGIRFSTKVSNPDGTRITSLTLADGTPITPSTTYRIVTNNYLATGGDNFSVFKLGTNLITGGSDITAFVDYVLWKWGTPPANTPFSSPLTGRITVVP
ncbi:MAG: 5'-nucleotidase C-terminal domain-containing protein [bacterium]